MNAPGIFPRTYTATSLSELENIAAKVVAILEKQRTDRATILALEGDLGAGKTTLVQMIAKTLHVTEPVSSPTFVISKYYDLPSQRWSRLIHMDAYRLDGFPTEPLDLPTLFHDPQNLVCIEWPSIIKNDLPAKVISLKITVDTKETRTIEIDI